MFFHNLLGAHVADLQANHWDNGRFVGACQICVRPMVKPPGAEWKIAREGSVR
jgi:hypothetical protein